jgi:hypothetical protein
MMKKEVHRLAYLEQLKKDLAAAQALIKLMVDLGSKAQYLF